MSESSVTIVVDPEFGAQLSEAAASQPVWIAQVGNNRKEAERLWRDGARGITTFVVSEPFDREATVAGILGVVLEHHPRTRELRVIGCSVSESLRNALAEEGFLVSETNREGFVAHSSAAA